MEAEYIEPVGRLRPVVVAGHIGPVELELPVFPECTEPAVGAGQSYFFYLVLKIVRFLIIDN